MEISNIIFIVKGIAVSLQYMFISLIIGSALGITLACMQFTTNKILISFAKIYISVFRGTPLLVQLSLIYFGLPSVLGIDISGFIAGIIAFSLNSAAYVAETVRGGIQSVDRGQFEACSTLKIPYFLKMKDIILPQAIRATFPALVNESISLLKETALISTIGEADIMRRASLVAAEQYSYFQPLLIAAICYYVVVSLLGFIGKHYEKRMAC